MTASSSFPEYAASEGRLNGDRAWCAQSSNGSQEWLSIDLGKTVEICGVATQGREDINASVTYFKLFYSPDGSGWTTYTDEHGSHKVRLVSQEILNALARHESFV